MNSKLKFVLLLLSAALTSVVVYIFLHESGHALVAVACGAKITSFSIIRAYTSWVGGTYSVFTASALKAAGMVLPLIAAVIYMLFIFNKNRQGSFYRMFSLFFSLFPVMTLLAWVIVPIAYMAGDTNTPDDVIQFLNVSGLNPVIVIVVSLLIFLLSLLLAWKKGVMQIWLDLIRGAAK